MSVWRFLGRGSRGKPEAQAAAPIAAGDAITHLFGAPPAPVAEPPSAPASLPAAAPQAALVDAASFAAPPDLRVTALKRSRVLAIGSCFLQGIAAVWRQELDLDFIVVSEIFQFPEAPPASIETYDYQVIQIPLRVILRDDTLTRLEYGDEAGYAAAFERCRELIRRHLTTRLKWTIASGTPAFVMNFMEPQFNLNGRLHRRFDLRDPGNFVRRLNEELEAVARAHPNVWILDADRLAASFGRRYVQDDSLTMMNHNALISGAFTAKGRMEDPGPLSQTYALETGLAYRQALLQEAEAMFRTLRQADAVKLVVVDLDDTLWNGVSGDCDEVGPAMIEGWPIGFVEGLLYAKKRGVLLAIASKNDAARIDLIWPKIFRKLLAKEDFAAIFVDWNPKHENMAEILRLVNVLPGNVVFIDDNPVERDRMQAAFPTLRVLGRNPFLLRRIMLLAPEMQVAEVSAESAARTRMVQAQIQRETERTSLSAEDFARQQAIRLRIFTVAQAQDRRLQRCFELLNKTNQFNTTGQRWSQPDFSAFLASGGRIVAYEVEDRYTEYGLVGVVLLSNGRIVQWVMSCRVLGMGVEQAALCHIRGTGGQEMLADVVMTEVNQPALAFLRAAGFAPGEAAWILPASAKLAAPSFIAVESADGRALERC